MPPNARCRVVLAVLLGLSLGCAKDPARPYPSSGSFKPFPIDDYPAWSNDGSSIAYYRFYPSSDGPYGIYLISKWGGKPRLIAPGLFHAFRFSPDDRFLVSETFTSSIQLGIIDVATGASTHPVAVSPGRAVGRPGWSPDGRQIVYARGWSFAEPPDSGGIHIFDLRTGLDRPIGGVGTILLGGRPIWLPTGQISLIGSDELGRDMLMVVDVDGKNLRVLYTAGGPSIQSHHWYERPAAGLRGILFSVNEPGPLGGAFIASPDGSAVTRLSRFGPPLLGWDAEAFSPDGEEIVHHGWDPVDSLDVLFVTSVGDQSRATRRQLTRYEPPPGQTEAPSTPTAAAAFGSFPPRVP